MVSSPKILIAVLLAGILFTTAEAQFRISGTVRTLNDTSTGMPIQNVKIDVDSSSYIGFTDANGHYVIDNVPAGTHTLIFNKEAFKGFVEGYTLEGDSTFNVSMPSDTQHVDLGDTVVPASYVKDLYPDEGEGDPWWWRDKDSIFVFLSNARNIDSTRIDSAVIAINGSHSINKRMKRNYFILTPDSIKARTHGIIVHCQSPTGNHTTAYGNPEHIGYIEWADVNIGQFASEQIIQHEFGFAMDKKYPTLFSSNQISPTYTLWTIDDNAITWLAENHKLAELRGEQQARLLHINDYIMPTITNTPSILTSNLKDTTVTITWTNSFGADSYYLQCTTDSTFTAIMFSDSMLDRNSKSMQLHVGTKYYVRVQARNTAGLSGWSATSTFTTAFPLVTVNVASVDLGMVAANDTARQTLSISNSSVVSLTVDTIILGRHEFAITPTKLIIPPQDSAQITLLFMPDSTGTFVDTLMLRNNSPRSIVRIPVSGDCPNSVIHLLPGAISFGSVKVNSTMQTVFAITNTSISPLKVDSLYTCTQYFNVVHSLTNNVIPAADTVRLTIRFTPDSVRSYADTLYIANNSPETPFKVPLSGIGSPATGVSSRTELPKSYSLAQNYPNPFNPTTTVRYGIPSRSHVKLQIFNTLGQVVGTLVNAEQEAGYYEVPWQPNTSSGLYFYRLEAASTSDPSKSFSQVRKTVLIK